MRSKLRGAIEAIDRLVHEGDVDLALRMSQYALDDGHRRTRDPEWVDHQEARGQRLHLALDVVQERGHGGVETPLHDESVAATGQIRLFSLDESLEVLRPVRLQLNEHELH